MAVPALIPQYIDPSKVVHVENLRKALETFEARGELLVHVDRPRSLVVIDIKKKYLHLTHELRNRYLEWVAPKIAEWSLYFFEDLQGTRFPLNQPTLNQFIVLARQKYPSFKERNNAMEPVDKASGVALVQLRDFPRGIVPIEEGIKIKCEVKTWLYKKQ